MILTNRRIQTPAFVLKQWDLSLNVFLGTTCFIDSKNWCLHAAILLSPGNRFGTDWGYWVFSFKQKLWLRLIELLKSDSRLLNS